MSKYPIEAIKTSFLSALNNHQTLILSAPPGAGKSTVLPLWLLECDKLSQQKIYLLQPRRIAAKNIACYLAKQLGEMVGETVGYRLRNEVNISKNTRLEVITEGILTQIIQNDAELNGCGLVIFDEFHQRSLQGDIAFALTRDCQQALREDLTLLLMSATLDSQQLQQKLPDAYALKSEGRSFPVTISYHAPKNKQYWREYALTVIKSQLQHNQGSILVFVAGIADIYFMVERLKADLPDNVDLLPLYGNLPLAQQQQVIAPTAQGKYKLVIATNIAETSLTIEGINCVIDCGVENIAQYDNGSLLNKLVQQQISKAAAIQRAGRAGRVMAGHCIRLYAKEDFERRAEHNISEIQRADLLPSLIEAARWGVTKLADLPLLELPSSIKEQQAWQELINLNIVNQQHKLTAHGEQVAQLSCHPRFSHMLLKAKTLTDIAEVKQLTALACYIAALLEEKDLYFTQQAQNNSDLRHRIIDLLNNQCTEKALVQRIIKQAKRLAKQLNIQLTNNISGDVINKTGLLLALAYPERIAKARPIVGEFVAANGKGFSLNNQDKLVEEKFLVAAQLMTVKTGKKLVARLAAPISLLEIKSLFKEQIKSQTVVNYHEQNARIEVFSSVNLQQLILEKKPLKKLPSPTQIAQLWCDLLRKKGINFSQQSLFSWPDPALRLIYRWQWLNNFVSNVDVPILSEDYLMQHLDSWFSPFVGEIKSAMQLAKLNFVEMLMSLLTYQQKNTLNQLAPEYYVSPTGRRCLISYSPEQQSPKVSLPMQEVYGLVQTPSVGNSQNSATIPLVLELLSPAGRPIQVTQNLNQFFQGSYKAVQKEMKSRYPKHYWPDDPARAKATNKTKRFINNH